MTILIDNRAGSKQLIRHPPLSTLGVLENFETLGYPGDVVFYGNGPNDIPISVGIEVKSLQDFYGSTDTGRLTGVDGQIPRMIDHGYDYIFVIYYAVYRASKGDKSPHVRYINKRGKWSTMKLGPQFCWFTGLTSTITELQLANIIVLRFNTIQEVALSVGTLYNFFAKPWSTHKLFHQFNTSPAIGGRSSLIPKIAPKVLQRAKVVSSIMQDFNRGEGVTGGMGYKKSIELARHFSSVHEMIDALATDPDRVAKISWKVTTKSGKNKGKQRVMTIGPVIANALQAAVISGDTLESELLARYKSELRQKRR